MSIINFSLFRGFELTQNNLISEFLTQSTSKIPLLSFIYNFLLAVLCSYFLSKIYQKFGNSLSNRKSFSEGFVILTTTTLLIISIVKSSLALSLGLVGALSIVRFRTALKEPEELIYAFLCIALGLGFGANQTFITLLGFGFIVSYIYFRSKFRGKYNEEVLNLIISWEKPNEIDLEEIITEIGSCCDSIKLKRLSQDNNFIESSFSIQVGDYKKFLVIKDVLSKKSDNISFSFIDSSVIPNL